MICLVDCIKRMLNYGWAGALVIRFLFTEINLVARILERYLNGSRTTPERFLCDAKTILVRVSSDSCASLKRFLCESQAMCESQALKRFLCESQAILIRWTEECLEVTSVPLPLGSRVAQCKNKGSLGELVLGHECPNASCLTGHGCPKASLSRTTSVLRRVLSRATSILSQVVVTA
ncbi:hypothetical protein WN51_06547 [Melipona quadrifasciata]|uniref:Uncharacterized protein n=1 Tax=Melipona quadrifasciata TaxID=166423 RepID=A0A0M8ZTR9_9HYME|nr:hypothetical protein WN51_06547 [Melipona quadrifasciata]